MDQTLFALPILPGKTEAARAFLQELEGARKEQYAASQQRLGVIKEVWAIQPTGTGDLYVVYFAGRSGGEVFQQFAASQDEFDRWCKQRLSETTGADLSTPPPGPLSQILVDYQAQ
jgi:hypothetical protein